MSSLLNGSSSRNTEYPRSMKEIQGGIDRGAGEKLKFG